MKRRIDPVVLVVLVAVVVLALGLPGCGAGDSAGTQASPLSADVESLILDAAKATTGEGMTLKLTGEQSETLKLDTTRWSMKMDATADVVCPSTARMSVSMQGGSGEPFEVEVVTLDGKTLYGRVVDKTDWIEAPPGSLPAPLNVSEYYAALPGATKEVDQVREETLDGVPCTVVQLEIDLAALIEASPSSDIDRAIFDAAAVSAADVDEAIAGATATITLWIGVDDDLIYRELGSVIMTLPGGGKYSSRDDTRYSAFGEEIVPPITAPKIET